MIQPSQSLPTGLTGSCYCKLQFYGRGLFGTPPLTWVGGPYAGWAGAARRAVSAVPALLSAGLDQPVRTLSGGDTPQALLWLCSDMRESAAGCPLPRPSGGALRNTAAGCGLPCIRSQFPLPVSGHILLVMSLCSSSLLCRCPAFSRTTKPFLLARCPWLHVRSIMQPGHACVHGCTVSHAMLGTTRQL